MDHDTRRFVHEAKREMKLLMAECSEIRSTAEIGQVAETECASKEEDSHLGDFIEDRETEVIMRSSMGGSANLAFFIPYLWKHRH